jgi:hypothetical protein
MKRQVIKAIDLMIGHSAYTQQVQFIRWCQQAATTPGHDLEDPKLQMIRKYQRNARRKVETW